MKVGCYVTVDDGDNYVTFHRLNVRVKIKTIGSLSTRVFETRTATGREHFACWDPIVTQIFILLISNKEKIFSNVNEVV